MPVHSIIQIQNIPSAPDPVWSFFANPGNLGLITPPTMDFQVLKPAFSDEIYPGQLIEYRLRPFPWMHTYWLTEITHVSPGRNFVDEQRRGPYSLWHHQHHFKEIKGGVEMTDLVHYSIPYGFLGRWANILFVRRQLDQLFAYRRQRIEELLGVWR
jgi:ligand-binding SRPBCC domain-containing protein